MSKIKAVRDIAKDQLVSPLPLRKQSTRLLWEKTKRMVSNIEHICQLPELSRSGIDIDRVSLLAAAYFSLAASSSGQRQRATIKPGRHLELSAEIASEKLEHIFPPQQIKKISGTITESGNRFTRKLEAMILSDIRNLDDMGITGIMNELSRYTLTGRTTADLLQNWQKKIDYKYWHARLKEGFHFEPVRQLAEARLDAASQLMDQLRMEINSIDFQNIASETQTVQSDTCLD